MTRWFKEIFSLCVLLAACSGEEEEPFPENPLLLGVTFSPMYSAFGGSHHYAVTPMVSRVADDPKVSATLVWRVDENFVSRSPFDALPAAIKLTTRAAGSTEVQVKGERFGWAFGLRSQLHIARANDEDWARGEARFHGGPRLGLASMLVNADSTETSPGCVERLGPKGLPRDAACASCHDESSEGDSIPISPAQLAGFTDEDLIDIITHGRAAGGPFYRSLMPEVSCWDFASYDDFHAWAVDDEDMTGLLLKLRSLTPQASEPLDLPRLHAEADALRASASDTPTL